MYKALALFALVALASASNVPRIHIDKTNLVLKEGFREVITFRLDEPIICPSNQQGCAVTVLVDNPHKDQVVIDDCQVQWDWNEWDEPRYITVSAVQDNVDDGYSDIVLATQAAISDSEYYGGFDPADIVIKAEPSPAGHCRGTGDPHYTTFDGKYWHVYWPGRYVLYKSTRPGRTFEAQVATRLRPARHCGIAVREGNDVVVVYACDGLVKHRRTCGSQECREGGFPKLKISARDGYRGEYYIEFASGVFIRFSVAGHRYANVYVTGSSLDANGFSAGICGNFDGNPNNDAPVYRANSRSQMKSEQLPSYDLFNWMPSGGDPPSQPKPKPGGKCEYNPPIFTRPILTHPDAEDITNLIKDQIVNEDGTTGINFGDDDEDDRSDEVSIEEATRICAEHIVNSQVAKVCREVLGTEFSPDRFVEDCVEDLALTGNTDFIADAMEAMERDCAERGARDLNTWETDNDGKPVEPSKKLQENLCPNQCSGNGVCEQATCKCNQGFTGGDCSIDMSKPPKVTSAVTPFCDVIGRKDCDHQVSVVGQNFFRPEDPKNLKCKFGDEVTEAFFLGSVEVLCALPRTDFLDGNTRELERVKITVTTDGENFGESDAYYHFYNSVCDTCNPTSGTCSANPDSCVINDECKMATETAPNNVCLQCLPDESKTEFSYSYDNHLDCGPQFAQPSYDARVVGGLSDGEELPHSAQAHNELTKDDPNRKYTYTIRGEDAFRVDEDTGKIYATRDISMPLPSGFNTLIILAVTDQAGNTASTQLVVEFLESLEKSVFPEEGFKFSVDENSDIGTVVGEVVANGLSDTDKEYEWLSVENDAHEVFSIDNNGQITVAGEVDFEEHPKYTLLVQMRAPQVFATKVVISVNNVDEAPTDITIDSDNIDENAGVNAVVGKLTTVDPEGGSHTYSVKGNNFDVNDDDELIAKRSFNYEGGDKEFDVEVTSTDEDGLSLTKTIKIVVNDINEKPKDIELSRTEFPEDFKVDSAMATVTATDPDGDTVHCALASSDSNRFSMSGDKLILLKRLDFEKKEAHQIQIVCVDDGTPRLASDTATFTITVTDAPDYPEDIEFDSSEEVKEDTAVNTAIGTIKATDYDADSTTISFEIIGESKFALGDTSCPEKTPGSSDPVTCSVELILKEPLNYEEAPTEFVEIKATDATGRFDQVRVSVPVADVNDAPSGFVWIGSGSFSEDVELDQVVAEFRAVDDDREQTYTYELESNTDVFSIRMKADDRRRNTNGVIGQVVVTDPSKINFLDTSSYDMTIKVTDSGTPPKSGTFTKALQVTDAPLEVLFKQLPNPIDEMTLSETISVGSKYDLVVRGNDMSNMDYKVALVDDANGRFSLEGNSPSNIKLVINKALDYEDQQRIDVELRCVATPTSSNYNGYVPPAHTTRLTVNVQDEDEGPVFVDSNDQPAASFDVAMSDDEKVGQTVYTFKAYDPEFPADDVVLFIPSSNNAKIRSLFTMELDGSLRVSAVPSEVDVAPGDYTLTISATYGGMTTTVIVNLSVQDGCFNDPCVNGACQDAYGTFTCVCDNGYEGDTCDQKVSKSSSGSMAGGTLAGVIVGVLVVIVLVAAVLFLIVSRNKDKGPMDEESGAVKTFNQNPAFGDVAAASGSVFTPGVANPVYEWYKPEMSRQDCTSQLQIQPVGAFVVRDSKATPGWHMIGVRTGQDVVHEKIKFTEDGMYQLVTNTSSPKFRDIPDLVQHYSSPQPDASFVLQGSSLSNPMYGAQQGGAATGYYDPNAFRNDPSAPAVPLKNRERDVVATVASGDDDIYTNTVQAKQAMSEA